MPFIFKAFITLVADADAVSDPATQKALISNSTIIKSSDKTHLKSAKLGPKDSFDPPRKINSK